MSTFSNRDLFRAAIINGLLASGEYSLSELEELSHPVSRVVMEYAGSIFDTQYPEGVSRKESGAAEQCLYDFMTEPRYLARVMDHLVNLGFSEQIARYAYRNAIEGEWLNIEVADGAPMLVRIEEVQS